MTQLQSRLWAIPSPLESCFGLTTYLPSTLTCTWVGMINVGKVYWALQLKLSSSSASSTSVGDSTSDFKRFALPAPYPTSLTMNGLLPGVAQVTRETNATLRSGAREVEIYAHSKSPAPRIIRWPSHSRAF